MDTGHLIKYPGISIRYLKFVTVVAVFTLFFPMARSLADHSWNGYHWARTQNPFTLQVVDSVTAEWKFTLSESLSRWSFSEVLNLTVVSTDDASKTRKLCRIYSGQMHVCNASYGFNGWLGLATVGLDSQGHIDRGSAKLNDSYSSYWTSEDVKNHVMCQELGHVFGLDHTSEDGSSQKTCMDYSWDIDSQWPNAHDYEQLAVMYSHLDGYDSFAGGDSGSGDPGVCNAPPGKGCNKNGSIGDVPPMGVRVVKNKNHEIWVAPRSDGGLWIHHIRLVPEP